MKPLFIAAAALALLGCGPPDEAELVASTGQALDSPEVTMNELPAPLQALIDAAKGRVVLAQDPVEDRFFHVMTVNQTPPPTPLPPCPSCR